MMVHRLIDAIVTQSPNLILGSTVNIPPLLKLLKMSEKFDFGELHLEDSGKRSSLDGSMIWNQPKLTPEELSFVRDGLIPLPAPCCWYEFNLGGHGSGILVLNGWRCTRLDFDRDRGTGVIDGSWVEPDPDKDDGILVRISPEIKRLLGTGTEYNITASLHLAQYFTLMLGSKTTEVAQVPGKKSTGGHKTPCLPTGW